MQKSTAKAPVNITHIRHGAISDSVSLSATTFYLNKNSISAPISGNITGVNFAQGDKIKKGQLFFSMQTRESQVLQSDTLSNLGKIKIRAPSDGTITNVYYSTGDYVQKGSMLAKIASPDNLYLKLFVPFEYESKISKNRKLNIRLPSGQVVSATYSRTLSQTDTSSQSLIWLFKPNHPQLLPRGITFSVQVPTIRHTDTQILPKRAVLSNTTLNKFWIMKVVHDSIAVKVPVRKGIETSRHVEILRPKFKPSTKIIINGQYGMEDSSLVQIQKNNL
ncbi:MAG TPA: biotin/lipoyl-binding protein [Balneolaceae bacterium]|nr:biotin/lipoyl-binding protein [Balneolaceae bacterium]